MTVITLIAAAGGWVMAYIQIRANRRLQNETIELQQQHQREITELQQQWHKEAADLEYQRSHARQASEWAVSSDPDTRRLGAAHLHKMLIADTTDENLRDDVRTTLLVALAPITYQATPDVTLAQIPGTPPPTRPSPGAQPDPDVQSDTGGAS